MEKNKPKKKSNLIPTIILIFAVISSILIIFDVVSNVSTELELINNGVEIIKTAKPTLGPRPTLPPDYTPEPIEDA